MAEEEEGSSSSITGYGRNTSLRDTAKRSLDGVLVLLYHRCMWASFSQLICSPGPGMKEDRLNGRGEVFFCTLRHKSYLYRRERERVKRMI